MKSNIFRLQKLLTTRNPLNDKRARSATEANRDTQSKSSNAHHKLCECYSGGHPRDPAPTIDSLERNTYMAHTTRLHETTNCTLWKSQTIATEGALLIHIAMSDTRKQHASASPNAHNSPGRDEESHRQGGIE